MSERVAIIGLGYVGLPVALAFARKFPVCAAYAWFERFEQATPAGAHNHRLEIR